jgi:tricorn protease
MQNTFRGHLAVLVDEYTYSDGETFAAGIKSLGLGPLVGKRTAGAGVWLSDNNRLSDNGMARVAEMGQFNSEDGQWLIEGVGVSPDVVVDNPAARHLPRPGPPAGSGAAAAVQKMTEQPVKPYQPQVIRD